jgi:hypothetical protein
MPRFGRPDVLSVGVDDEGDHDDDRQNPDKSRKRQEHDTTD